MLRSAITACLLVCAAPALACSVQAKYRVPTNVELLNEADLVVLALVQTGPRTVAEAWTLNDEPRVVLMPVKALKGVAPKELRVLGILTDEGGRPYRAIPTTLNQVHPTTMEGMCIRQGYSQGAMVLAMFRRTRNGYMQLNDPFARAVEDVKGPTALWPRAASLYLQILSIKDPKAQRSAFRREQRRLAATGGPNGSAIAADIGRYLKVIRK